MEKKLGVVFFTLGYLIIHTSQSILLSSGNLLSLTPANIIVNFVSGLLLAFLLALIVPQTKLKRSDLIVFLLLIFFVVMKFTNIIEGLFFTTLVSFSNVISASIISLFEAVLAALIFGQQEFKETLSVLLVKYFHCRKLPFWMGRITFSVVAYLPVYFLFGMIVSPFVIPFYSNPVYGLKIPPFSQIIPLEIVRGFLYTLTFLPFFALFRRDQKTTFIIITSILFIPGAFIPLLSNTLLPRGIIPFHMVEILGDSIVYGLILTKLLFIKK